MGRFSASQWCQHELLDFLVAVTEEHDDDALLSDEDVDFYFQYIGMAPQLSFCTAPTA